MTGCTCMPLLKDHGKDCKMRSFGQKSYSPRFKGAFYIYFFNGPSPASFSVYFLSFQANITIFTTSICGKCPSSIWCWDSNPRPSEHESTPLTNRPGLPPFNIYLWQSIPIKLAWDCLKEGLSRLVIWKFSA